MATDHKKLFSLTFGLIFLTGILPVILYVVSFDASSVEVAELPFRESPLYQQGITVIAAFVIKPTYMLLSLTLIIFLWHKRSLDLVALRWGLIAFLVGESFCSINYLFFNEQSHLMEYLHSFGMVVSLGFITFAVMEGLDQRIVKYSNPDARCVWLGMCRNCIKYKDVPCGLNRIFKLTIPALIIIGVMPLNAVTQFISYNTDIVGTLYNYTHAELYQFFEIRYAPIVAIGLFVASFLTLPRHHTGDVLLSKVFIGAGVGFLAFSFFRLVLLSFYSDNMVWFVFWEEATELLLIVSIGAVLWIFRESLLRTNAIASTS